MKKKLNCRSCSKKIRKFCGRQSIMKGSILCDLARAKRWSKLRERTGRG